MIEVPVPKWGLTMEEAVVTKWLKRVGEPVEEGEPIAELEADKVDGEVNSPAKGTMAQLLVDEGAVVEPGQVIAYLEEGG